MNNSSDSINGIAAWLQVALGVPSLNARADLQRDVILFWVSATTERKFGELGISEEALADHSPETIISDLQWQRVPWRLKSDPTMRLAYGTDRDIPHLETRFVRCDGRTYRFVRDAGHAVRVYDADGSLLTNLASPLAVKPTSLFRRDDVDLCGDVRGWRGPNQ